MCHENEPCRGNRSRPDRDRKRSSWVAGRIGSKRIPISRALPDQARPSRSPARTARRSEERSSTFLRAPLRSPSQLGVVIRPGQRVALTNTSGVELQGKVAQISDRGMTLMMRGGPITIDERELVQVQRVGDPLWNGALIGLGAGFGAGLLSMARCDAGLVCGAAAGPVVLA